MTINIVLFEGAHRVGSIKLPAGQEMPEVVLYCDDVYVYFQGSVLIAGQRPGQYELLLQEGESARFLKVSNVFRIGLGDPLM